MLNAGPIYRQQGPIHAAGEADSADAFGKKEAPTVKSRKCPIHRPDTKEAAVDLVDVCIADIVVVEVADDESSAEFGGSLG